MVSVCLPSDALCNTYHLTWVSLTLDVGYLFTAAQARWSCCSLPWMKSVSYRCPSWPSRWDGSSMAALGLQCWTQAFSGCGEDFSLFDYVYREDLRSQPYLTQWNYEPCPVELPKMKGSWWRFLTKCGPLEKGMPNHFSILALRTLWTVSCQ